MIISKYLFGIRVLRESAGRPFRWSFASYRITFNNSRLFNNFRL